VGMAAPVRALRKDSAKAAVPSSPSDNAQPGELDSVGDESAGAESTGANASGENKTDSKNTDGK
ncbi:MAG: hypothetical protein KA794_16350, partial [Candidatus Obscuribacter sp.]|nr:hypothetical protein [Candidatus Obscuribacter sp.]